MEQTYLIPSLWPVDGTTPHRPAHPNPAVRSLPRHFSSQYLMEHGRSTALSWPSSPYILHALQWTTPDCSTPHSTATDSRALPRPHPTPGTPTPNSAKLSPKKPWRKTFSTQSVSAWKRRTVLMNWWRRIPASQWRFFPVQPIRPGTAHTNPPSLRGPISPHPIDSNSPKERPESADWQTNPFLSTSPTVPGDPLRSRNSPPWKSSVRSFHPKAVPFSHWNPRWEFSDESWWNRRLRSSSISHPVTAPTTASWRSKLQWGKHSSRFSSSRDVPEWNGTISKWGKEKKRPHRFRRKIQLLEECGAPVAVPATFPVTCRLISCVFSFFCTGFRCARDTPLGIARWSGPVRRGVPGSRRLWLIWESSRKRCMKWGKFRRSFHQCGVDCE